VAAIAAAHAQRIIQKEVPLYLHKALNLTGAVTTVSICFSAKQEQLVKEACAAINHRFSSFVLWALMAYLDEVGVARVTRAQRRRP